MNNHLEIDEPEEDDPHEENPESEILDDDVIVVDDELDLMTVSPPYGELGLEMRQLGLSNYVLYEQIHPTRP